jgi:aminoglycoside phosphotransferase (APT) family kinase protein
MAAQTPEIPPIVAHTQRSLDDLAARLSGWLPGRIPGATDVEISDLQYPRGAGLSHETILFTARWTESGRTREKGLVVRIKPPADKSVYLDDMYIEQFRLMQAVHASGQVTVAEALWLEEDSALLGAPFFVMERKAGRVAVSYPPYAAQQRRAWENGVRQLASIQRIPLDSVGFLALPGGGPTGFGQELDRWRRYLAWVEEAGPMPFHDLAFAELERRAPANPPPGIVWGDARIGNMMFDENFDIVAVMDWEQPSLGGALHDLAWWLYNEYVMSEGRGLPRLPGFGSFDETLALWSEVSGIAVTDFDWYLAFAAFKGDCLRIHMIDGGWYESQPGNDFADSVGTRYIAQKLGLTPPEPQPTR